MLLLLQFVVLHEAHVGIGGILISLVTHRLRRRQLVLLSLYAETREDDFYVCAQRCAQLDRWSADARDPFSWPTSILAKTLEAFHLANQDLEDKGPATL